MTRLNRDVVAGLVLVAIGVFGIVVARGIQAPVAVDPLGPKTYPEILLAILGALGIGIAIQGLRNGAGPTTTDEGEEDAEPAEPAPLRTIAVLILGVVYVTVLGPLGYIVTTAGTLFALMLVLGLRDPLRAAVVAIAMTLVLYSFFDLLLEVPLPEGILG